MTAQAKSDAVNGRISQLKNFLADNADMDVRYIDFFGSSDGLNWGNIAGDDKTRIRNQLMSGQRMMELADNTDDRFAMLQKGFDSAWTISNYTETQFANAMGFDQVKAQRHHQKALLSVHRSSHYFQTVQDTVAGVFKNTKASNIDPSLVNNMAAIDGFQNLFGPQSYCDCEDCRSVISPAAYFVDLMQFIKEHISRPVFINKNLTDNSLYLKNRRDDLWHLKLSCENTNTLIPYLDIVDEVLENYIGKMIAGDVYEMLSQSYANDSFKLPFNLPLEELRIYLGHFNYTLFDAFRLLKLDDLHIWREQLKLSQEELEIITATNPNHAPFQIWRIPGSQAVLIDDADDPGQNINASGLLNIAGISRVQLTDFLDSKFNPALKNIQVNKIAQSQGFGFIETLNNISDDDLDYMQRFIRLQKKTGWEVPDLDDVLNQMQKSGSIQSTLNQSAVLLVGEWHYIKHELKLSIDRLCAMIYEMPVSESFPVPPEQTEDLRLYEKAFDLENIFGIANKDTGALNTTANYHLYTLDISNTGDTQIDPATPYLVGGLGITEPELMLLFSLLKNEMQFDNNGNAVLDRLKISLLYRHAKLARALQLSIEDFIDVLSLVFDPTQMVVKSAEQILQMMDFCDQLDKWNLSPQEMVFIVNGTSTSNITYNTTTDVLSSMIDAIKNTTDPDKISEFKNQLQQQFSISQDLLQDMLQWILADINDPAIVNLLNQPVADEPDATAMAPLMQLCQQMERVQHLFNKFSYDEEQVGYLSSNFSMLGISDLKDLKAADLFNLGYFKSLIVKDAETEASMENELASYKTAGNFSDDSISTLALFWNVQVNLVKSIISSLALSAVPLEAISYVDQALSVCNLLGINGYSMKKLGNDSSYQAIKSAKNVALGAFSSKYEDETVREETLEPYNDKINVAKRNALCEFILAKEKILHFKNKNDLYDFFLVDVKMGGCSRTSRIDCAVCSLQLYVTRVIANLEQSADGNISVLTDMEGLGDFKDEWEWRGNYSTWVSNRKVFLYPENYIQPESLDIQTSLYSDLQNQLLQGKVTKASVEAAYNNYIAGFSDLAQLKICGSFYDIKEKTYYLFGRTTQDPGQLYFRTWQDRSEWTSWEAINLSTSSQHIAAAKYLQRLFIFWLDIREDKKTSIQNSNASISSVTYYYTLNFSYQKEDRKWSTTQKLDYGIVPDIMGWKYSHPNYARNEELLFKDRFRATKIYCDSDSGLIIENFVVPFINRALAASINLFSNQVNAVSPTPVHTSDQTVYLFSGSLIDEDPKPTNYEAALFIGKKLGGSVSSVDYNLVMRDISGMTQMTGIFSGKTNEPYLTLVQGTTGSYYFRMGSQQFLIYAAPAFSGNKRISQMVRISTSLPEEFSRILFKYGIKQFLSLNTQMKTEQDIKIQFLHPKKLHPPYLNPQHLDFKGPYGQYFTELFFHIPFMIADHLNSNQQFETAKWWYERIFDPTAKEAPQDKKPADRCWRYIEFRDVNIEKMQTALTDKAAIDQYKKNPFDADAIARMRIGVYQKAIVMKYIDNLLDWGDSLFTRFTMESVNEAMMLYMLASDILGRRPADTGPCNEADEDELTFNELSSVLDGDSDFLIYLETWSNTQKNQTDFSRLKVGEYINNAGPNRPQPQNDEANFSDIEQALDPALQAAMQQKPAVSYNVATYAQTSESINGIAQEIYNPQVTKRLPGHEIAKQTCLAFCVPKNDVLLGYWDRVEDRLYKIRHCMNILGVKKQLALFQSGVNQKFIDKAEEAGLSLEEMLKALSKPLPPYRFEYLIEKAKQFTQTVQNFGNSLLSAMEKKDTEQLNLLRTLHEKQILNLTTKAKEDAVSQVQSEEQALEEQKKNIQNRIDYYSNLLDGGLNMWELAEEQFKKDSILMQVGGSIYQVDAAIGHLLPQIGSPFAITFGGEEVGDSMVDMAGFMRANAEIANSISASAGLTASRERRDDEWQQQLILAEQDMQQMQKQLLAAQFKIDIAKRELTVHNKNVQQNEEVMNFFKNKFTNLGLYQYLSNNLTRLYRDAYNLAFDMALQAEQGYQFETDDDNFYISTDNWQYDRAGLLAGERLTLQLHSLEKAYIENNKRTYEINQSVSLALLNPPALLQLKESGACTFIIPEIAYDIAYPGQFKRIIKSVRVTIPCIAGPYINISAKLTLTDSWVRTKEKLNTNPLKLSENSEDELKMVKNISISTSSAQNDGGLFDLNFRDERYLPFEGAGAVSSWKLELPATLRSFNYDTISDVIFHISYTANDDAVFRTTVENNIMASLSDLCSCERPYAYL